MHEYAHAQHAHRVLTEDVRLLNDDDKEQVLGKERAVVASFSEAVAQIRPDADKAGLSKALAMLLFGMMNWMFTWLKPDGQLNHETMAPMVADLFMGGIEAVETPIQTTQKKLACI